MVFTYYIGRKLGNYDLNQQQINVCLQLWAQVTQQVTPPNFLDFVLTHHQQHF